MNHINAVLNNLDLGKPLTHEGLSIFPLLRQEPFARDYLTLDEALAAHSAVITEISEGGSVPNLLFRNKGEQAVFLLDGEELVGAKQNRILNITILAPGMKDTIIPVSCVEAGRWSHNSPDFSTAPRTQFSASRAKRSAHVSEDIAMNCERRSDQGEVWQDISAKLDSLGSRSDTGAVESAFKDNESSLNNFVDKLQPQENQSGAVFCINGRVSGMELFDSQDTCKALMPKIIRSYALDAIDPNFKNSESHDQPDPGRLLETIRKARTHEAKAVGEGTDLRFDNASGVAGGALFARDRIIHLVAFSMKAPSMHSSDRVYRRRAF